MRHDRLLVTPRIKRREKEEGTRKEREKNEKEVEREEKKEEKGEKGREEGPGVFGSGTGTMRQNFLQ